MIAPAVPLLSVLTPVEDALLGALNWIHETLGVSWAWAIILLTVAVRLVLVPLTVKQQQSMRKLQALQPEIKKLQAKHKGDKGDRQTLNQEMMGLYKENKANPMGSCLPLLVQMPVFLAMFFVLRHLDEEMDPSDDRSFLGGFLPDITLYLHQIPSSTLVVLMIVYIGSQIGSTLLMPTSLDKTQRYLFLALPIVFAFVLIKQDFPAGLMLYWITTNLWTVGQAATIRWVFPNPNLTTTTTGDAASKATTGTRRPVAEAGAGGSSWLKDLTSRLKPETEPPRRAPSKAAKAASGSARTADKKPARPAKPATSGVHPAARKGRAARRPGEGAQPPAASANGSPIGRARRRGAADTPAQGEGASGSSPPTSGPARRRGRRGGPGEAPATEGGD